MQGDDKTMKKISAFFAAFLLLLPVLSGSASAVWLGNPEFLSMIEEEETPVLYISSADAAVGDTVSITISMGNVQGFTSGDIVVQYNPYMLQYEGFEMSTELSSTSVYLEATEKNESSTDIHGNIPHEVYIGLLHMEEFPAALDECDVGTITFTAIGGGACDLEITAMSFDFEGQEIAPRVNVGEVRVEGEEASSWDYDAITSAVITVPDGQYAVETTRSLSTTMKVVIALAIIAIVIVIVLVIAKGRNIVDDENGDANDEEANAPAAPEQQTEAPKTEPVETEQEPQNNDEQKS